MALAAIGAVAGIANAGAGIYGALSQAQSQRDANKIAAATYASNRDAQLINSLMATTGQSRNIVQQALDNLRYDQAVGREDSQRQFTNRLATSTQVDADGNMTTYDPATGTWRVVQSGTGALNADRRRTLQGNQFQGALHDALVTGRLNMDRTVAAGRHQGNERALGEALLARYGANQGRDVNAIRGAMTEANVAQAMDPLVSAGNSAMLAGYRQGNSGNDALLGSLARNGAAGTRSAIANARLSAPLEALNERDAAAKGILGPATTLASRGSSAIGGSAPVFSGDVGSSLLASLNRGNAAGVGTTLNPVRGSQSPVYPVSNDLKGFSPLNATGTQAAGIGQGLNNLMQTLQRSGIGWLDGREAPTTGSNTVSRARYDDQQFGVGM